MAFALQARVVFLVDRPPIEHGVVTIDGERIVAVGTKAEAGELTDLGDVALLPCLVNAHTHLEFSHLQRPLGTPGMRLVDWIRLVIAERGRLETAADVSITTGLTESVGHGVSLLGEISSDITDAYALANVDVTAFVEVIGFSRARADSAFAAVTQRLDVLTASPISRPGISPHAPYTVSPALLKKLISLAIERRMPIAMHIAESMEELELLRNGTGPFQELLDERSMWDAEAIPRNSRPLDYLRMLAEAPLALVIHGNYLDAEEHAFLAANVDRMSLVYCPRTHHYFGHPPYALRELMEHGVRVVLGTDSRASNPDLDLLAEMRFVAGKYPSIDPQRILRMGTLNGAEALGRESETGSITAAKFANLTAIPIQNTKSTTPSGVLEGILDGHQKPNGIWFQGCNALQ